MIRTRLVVLTAAAAVALAVSSSVAVAASSGGGKPPARGEPTPDALAAAHRAAAEATSPQDLYTAITPCRVVNTHAGKPIAAKAIRTFYVSGTSGFKPQGGRNGGCGIPSYATSAAATVTAVHPSGSGSLTLFAAGQKAPKTIGLSFAKGQQTSSGTQTALRSGGARQLAVKSSTKTDVMVDVVGYWSPQLYGTFDSSGALVSGNGTLTQYSHGATGYYTLLADRDLTGCTPTVSAYYYAYNASGYVYGNAIYIQMTNSADGTPANYYFQVHVAC